MRWQGAVTVVEWQGWPMEIIKYLLVKLVYPLVNWVSVVPDGF